MARVRILQGVAGDDFSWTPGDVVDLPEEEAVKWADGYRGERVDEPKPAPKPEPKAEEKPKAPAKRAAPKPPETAAERSRGGGRARRTETREE